MWAGFLSVILLSGGVACIALHLSLQFLYSRTKAEAKIETDALIAKSAKDSLSILC